MKRILPLLMAALLLPALSLGAAAAGQAEIVRAFGAGETLYTYVDLGEGGQPITRAEATLDGRTFQTTGRLETVRQAGSPVSYLLMVDASTSMPGFQEDVVGFAESLAEHSGENTRFTLATFGDGFQVIGEDVAPEEVPEQLAGLQYSEPITQLHSAIGQALDYFEGLPRQGNELRSLVVLTDAVEYDPQGGIPYDTLLERMERSDVMLHAIGFGGDRAALDRLNQLVEASDGSQWEIGEACTADQAADRLVKYTGRLFVLGFDLSGYVSDGAEQPLSLVFSSGAELVGQAESQVALPVSQDPGAEPEPDSGTELPAPEPEPGGGAPAAQPAEPEEQPENAALPLVIGIGAAVLVGILAAVVLGRRKKPEEVPQPAPAGIYMRLEVVRGAQGTERTEFTLRDELQIGRDPACDIVFDDETLSLRNSRVFLDQGAVYLEDLQSQNGTRMNGTPVYAPVRLRSGDEISVGSASFRLKF